MQAGAQEEIPPAVGTGDVARVDPADLQVDRIAPRPADAVGPDDVVRSVRRADAREVDVVAPLVLHEIRRPDRADVLEQRRPHRLPVDQVAGVPDDEARIRVERRERHVVVVAVPENRRVRVIARHDRIQKRAVPEVRLPLAFDAAGPGPAGLPFGLLRRRHHAECRGQGPERYPESRSAECQHRERIYHWSTRTASGGTTLRPRNVGRNQACLAEIQ